MSCSQRLTRKTALKINKSRQITGGGGWAGRGTWTGAKLKLKSPSRGIGSDEAAGQHIVSIFEFNLMAAN